MIESDPADPAAEVAHHSVVARGDGWVDVMIRAESGRARGPVGDALIRMTVEEYRAWTGHEP